MLPRVSRVRIPAEFSQTLRSGARAGRRNVVVSVVIPEPTQSHAPQDGRNRPPKAGFIVSKAVGNAVTRNRVKRRLRAAMAAQLAGPLAPHSGAMIVVRALPSSSEASWAELTADLDSGLRSAVKKAGPTGVTAGSGSSR